MKEEHILEYTKRVERFLDDSDIMCDWKSMDLRPLDEDNDEAKDVQRGQLMEEVMYRLLVEQLFRVNTYEILYRSPRRSFCTTSEIWYSSRLRGRFSRGFGCAKS